MAQSDAPTQAEIQIKTQFKTVRIAPRQRQSGTAFINTQTACQWPLRQQGQQQTPGAGAQINQAQGFVFRQQSQRRLNQCLAIGARVQHSRADMKPPPPKFLMADNFGDRHAGQAQGNQCLRVMDKRCARFLFGLHGQVG